MPTITATGSEFLVNQSTFGSQLLPVTIGLADGRFAVFWTDYITDAQDIVLSLSTADIKGRIFNADGSAAGDEFLVNATTTAGTQYRPQVTQLSDGNLIVVWQDGTGPVGPGPIPASAIRAQEISLDGSRVGNEFLIGSADLTATTPEVAALADGGFVAVWQSADTREIGGQRFDASNAPVGPAFGIVDPSIARLSRPDVLVLESGRFVVSWALTGQTNAHSARLYDADGTPVGSDLLRYSPGGTTFVPGASRLTATIDGGFVITTTFSYVAADGITLLHALNYDAYDADGGYLDGGAVTQDLSGGSRVNYDVAARSDGSVVVAWTAYDAPGDPDALGLLAVVIRSNGNTIGEPFRVNTTVPGIQGNPEIATLANGDFVISWYDDSGVGGDTSGSGIKAQLFTVTPGNTAPTAVNDSYADYFLNNIDATVLLDNDSDVDGDNLTVIGVSNARSGSVSLSNGIISFTPDAGYIGPAVFEYTISDGAGGSATATATFIGSRDDAFTVRGAGPHFFDVLANDGLEPRPQGYIYNANIAQQFGSVFFVNTALAPRLFYSPIQTFFPDYFNLEVGQSQQVTITYFVQDASTTIVEYFAAVNLTLQGWAQLGTITAETLIGSAEADHLSGGTGAANRLEGGGGDDWYTVAAAGDVIVEAADAGIDTVRAVVQAFELTANVENMNYIGNTGDFTGIGNASNNRLTGGNFNDTLVGLAGDDTLVGGNGNDLLFGGEGNDIYLTFGDDIVFEAADNGIDTVNASNSFYLFANIENLNLIQGSFGVGNDLDNAINGNDGSNLLIGGAGNDSIDGKGGIDSIFGETGDDTLIGGGGIDYLVGGTGNDRLEGGTDADALYGQDGNDILVGGSSFDTDILVGGDGNDTLNAASGLGDYDLIDGGAGDDVYYVDTPADLTFEAVNGGTDTIVANIVGAGYYLYANTENLILEGVTPFGVGNELDNNLTGNAIGNYLLGGEGNDTLNGKAGNDVLFGQAGIDVFTFERGTGGDVIGDFQAGVDKINLVNFGFTNYAQLQANIFEVAGTTAINLGQGDFIVINGMTNAALSALDFQFG